MPQELVALAEQLNQIRGEIEQSQTFPGSDPQLLERLKGVLAQMRAVTKETMANLEAQAMSMAGEMRQKADEMEKAAQQAASTASKKTPEPVGAWEDHQGLEPGWIPPLVTSLLQLAHPPQASRRH